jgi:hypothetical protein
VIEVYRAGVSMVAIVRWKHAQDRPSASYREVATEAEVEALVAEVRARLLEQVRAGRRVRFAVIRLVLRRKRRDNRLIINRLQPEAS